MTKTKIDEIIDLINNQENYILKLNGQFQVALSEKFLEENDKFAINNHLDIMDDHLNEISSLNNKIHLLCKNLKKDIEKKANENETIHNI